MPRTKHRRQPLASWCLSSGPGSSSIVSVACFPSPGRFLFLLALIPVTTPRKGFCYSPNGFLLLPAPSESRSVFWPSRRAGPVRALKFAAFSFVALRAPRSVTLSRPAPEQEGPPMLRCSRAPASQALRILLALCFCCQLPSDDVESRRAQAGSLSWDANSKDPPDSTALHRRRGPTVSFGKGRESCWFRRSFRAALPARKRS